MSTHEELALHLLKPIVDNPKAPWVKLYGNGPTSLMICERCEARTDDLVGLEVRRFLRTIKAFARLHRKCPVPQGKT